MSAFEKLLLKCCGCGRQATLDAEFLENRLGEALSIGSVGRLHGKLSCKGCAGREAVISDAAGHVLVDPVSLTLCRICGFPIPLPRLAAVPGATTCTACAADGAKPPPPPHYPQPPADRRLCPRCASPTVVRQNSEDQGFFLGCTAFPKCRWTAPFPQ